MKKVIVKADLSMVAQNHQINISGEDKELMVNIIGTSVLHVPFSVLLKGYGLRKKTTCLDQLIQIKTNGKNLLKINGGKIKIDNYPHTFRFLIKSLFG